MSLIAALCVSLSPCSVRNTAQFSPPPKYWRRWNSPLTTWPSHCFQASVILFPPPLCSLQVGLIIPEHSRWDYRTAFPGERETVTAQPRCRLLRWIFHGYRFLGNRVTAA